jgi:hypothetical protein
MPKTPVDPLKNCDPWLSEAFDLVSNGQTAELVTLPNIAAAKRLAWYRLRTAWYKFRPEEEPSPQRMCIQSSFAQITNTPDGMSLLTIGQVQGISDKVRAYEEKWWANFNNGVKRPDGNAILQELKEKQFAQLLHTEPVATTVPPKTAYSPPIEMPWDKPPED